MSPDEAKKYCEENGIGPQLSQGERQMLDVHDFRMFALAYSTGDVSAVPNNEWAQAAFERSEATIAEQSQVDDLRNTVGL